jgi:hypothetical protein
LNGFDELLAAAEARDEFQVKRTLLKIERADSTSVTNTLWFHGHIGVL